KRSVRAVTNVTNMNAGRLSTLFFSEGSRYCASFVHKLTWGSPCLGKARRSCSGQTTVGTAGLRIFAPARTASKRESAPTNPSARVAAVDVTTHRDSWHLVPLTPRAWDSSSTKRFVLTG